MQNLKPKKFLLRIYFKDGEVQRIQRKKKIRLSAIIRTIKNSEVHKYYLKVTYSNPRKSKNKRDRWINEGEYHNKNSLYQALNAFTEK